MKSQLDATTKCPQRERGRRPMSRVAVKRSRLAHIADRKKGVGRSGGSHTDNRGAEARAKWRLMARVTSLRNFHGLASRCESAWA